MTGSTGTGRRRRAEGFPQTGPAQELIESGFALENADAGFLHRGLNLADVAHVLDRLGANDELELAVDERQRRVRPDPCDLRLAQTTLWLGQFLEEFRPAALGQFGDRVAERVAVP